MDDIAFQAVSFCDGVTDINSALVLPIHRERIKTFKKFNIVSPCTGNRSINEYHKFKYFNNEYVHTAHWSITGKCNFNCRHCCLSAPSNKYGELSFDECIDIMNQLLECGVMNVSITGGEPLIRKDFMNLVDAFLDRKINISMIYTNGSLITEELLKELIKRNVRPVFSLSFDGLDYHDWLRNTRGAEKMALDAIRLLNKYAFPIDVEMCLHKLNSHTLQETVNFLSSIGVESLKTNPVGNVGEWKKENGKYDLTYDELYNIYLDYIPKFLEDGSPLTLHLGGFFYCEKNSQKYVVPAQKFDGTKSSLNNKLCDHAKKHMYICADGSLLPCFSMSGINFKKVYLTRTPLASALKSSSYLSLVNHTLDDLLKHNKTCKKCEYNLVCGGGCRANAVISNNNYLGYDESICIIFKKGYIDKIKENFKLEESVNA